MKRKWHCLMFVASLIFPVIGMSPAANASPSITISEIKQKTTFALVGDQFEMTLRVVSTNGTKNVSGQINAPSGGFLSSLGELVEGTDKDGIYRITFALASFAETGSYRIALYAVSAENLISNESGGTFQVYASIDEKIAAEKIAAEKIAADKLASTKKMTIICTKGKLTKKVTAIKPKCPTGYKKK
jgi:hypothetical protein